MLHHSFRKITSLAIVVTLACSFTVARVYQANFSGSWTLNEGKSELGQFGRASASKIVVDQKADNIVITRTSTGMDGAVSDATETMVEGKESESTVFNGAGKKKSVLKWADDKNTFLISSNIAIDRGGQSMEFKTGETWSLSADGKTLTLSNAISSPQGDITTKAVYDKQ